MWTFTSLMDFSQSALFLGPSFQSYAFINVCWYTVPPSVVWSSSYLTSLSIIVKYLTYFSFTIHSINMTNPIQPNYSDKLNYI